MDLFAMDCGYDEFDEGKLEKRLFVSDFELFIQAITDSNFDYINFYQKSGNTLRGFHDLPLKTAFKFNNKKIIHFFLSHIMIEDNKLDNSIFFESVSNGYDEVALSIIKQNLKLKMNHDWMVELSVNKGLENFLDFFYNRKYDFSNNPNFLIKAVQYNQLKSIKKLMEFGLDIHYQSDVALKLAAAANHFEIVKFLIDNGADPIKSKAYLVATPEIKEYLDSITEN